MVVSVIFTSVPHEVVCSTVSGTLHKYECSVEEKSMAAGCACSLNINPSVL